MLSYRPLVNNNNDTLHYGNVYDVHSCSDACHQAEEERGKSLVPIYILRMLSAKSQYHAQNRCSIERNQERTIYNTYLRMEDAKLGILRCYSDICTRDIIQNIERTVESLWWWRCGPSDYEAMAAQQNLPFSYDNVSWAKSAFLWA